MEPVSELLLRSSSVSSKRLPREAGIVPVRLSLERSNSVTRVGVPEVVTPSQLPSASVVAQFKVAVPRRVSLAASNASQSCTSPCLIAESVMTVAPAQA